MNRPTLSYEQLLDLNNTELTALGIKKALSYDTYGNNYDFEVRVLTTPLPMATSDIEAFFSPAQPESSTVETGGSTSNGSFPNQTHMAPAKSASRNKLIVNSFAFMGRIADYRDRPSPHRFIPDPGESFLFENDIQKRAAVIQHTNFVSNQGWQGTMPKIGDTVKVRLMPGDIQFNLQQAFFDDIQIISDGVNSFSPYSQISASGLFKGKRGAITDYAYTPQTAIYHGKIEAMKGKTITNGKMPNSLLAQVDTQWSYPGTVLIDILDDYNKMAKLYYEEGPWKSTAAGHKKFPLNGGYRFFETQKEIYEDPTMKNKDGKHLGAYPGTSLHGWGFAVDFHSRDKHGVKGFESEIYKWFYDNGDGRVNFKNPSWAQKGGSKAEAWHFEHQKTQNSVIKNIK